MKAALPGKKLERQKLFLCLSQRLKRWARTPLTCCFPSLPLPPHSSPTLAYSSTGERAVEVLQLLWRRFMGNSINTQADCLWTYGSTQRTNEHPKKYSSVEYLSAASIQSSYRSHTQKTLNSFSTILLLPWKLASFLANPSTSENITVLSTHLSLFPHKCKQNLKLQSFSCFRMLTIGCNKGVKIHPWLAQDVL